MEIIKTFLSYASEDYSVVVDFYDKLAKIGISPWMDKKDILPGENWEISIWRAVRNADFIIIFLSNHSVTKRGFFQKEIKTALKQWEEKLEDDIYIIPVIIEECEIPSSIGKIQWIKLFEENSFNKIIDAIRIGASKIGKTISYNPDVISINNKKIQESKSNELSYLIDVEYPQIEILGNNIFDEINNIISGKIIDIVQNSRRIGISYLDDKDLRETLTNYSATNDLYVGYYVHHISKKLLSIHFTISTYSAGAAHPLHGIMPINYELDPTMKLILYDLFKNNYDYLNIISEYCIDDLIKQLKSEEDFSHLANPDEGMERSIEWIKEGAGPKADNFEKFGINEDGLTIFFDDYQVGPYAWGHRLVEIPFSIFNDNVVNKTVLNLWKSKFV